MCAHGWPCAAFGSKEALYAEAVAQYMQLTRALLWRHLDDAPSAKEGMRGLLLATARELTNCEGHPIGCMVTFATVDETMPASVIAAIRNARRDWLKVIRERLETAVADNEIPRSTDLESLSRFFVGVVQSIGLQAHDGAAYAELENLVELAMAAWPASTARPRA
jgi:AcrR family transcriptional regulator